MNKTCKKCHKTKPIEMFHKLAANTDGHTGSCKECLNALARINAAKPERKIKKALYGKKWKETHREEWRVVHVKHQRRRNARMTTTERLKRNVRAKVWRQLKVGKYGKRTFDLLGYKPEDLMKHLEGLFQEGMTWENYGQWHIDHIIPQSVFNINNHDDLDFKKCWALQNLQPLWARDNYIKRDKIIKPFQPSLCIGVVS